MSVAALVVSRYKSPAGIGESERHALQCGLWLPTPPSSPSDDAAASSPACTAPNDRWTGYTWVDHPHTWEHLKSLLQLHPISVLHLHALDKLPTAPQITDRLQQLLREAAAALSSPETSNGTEAVALTPLVEYHDTVSHTSSGGHKTLLSSSSTTATSLQHVLKRHGISPMHIVPQLDTRVLQQATIFALGLMDNHNRNTLAATDGAGDATSSTSSPAIELSLGRMPLVMHLDAATASETLHIWPPATQGQAVVVGGTNSNNSLYGLLAASSTNHKQNYLSTILGQRCWALWLQQPRCDISEIVARQEAVSWFVTHGLARDSVQSSLKALNLDVTNLAQQLEAHQPPSLDEVTAADAPTISTRKSLQALYQLYLLSCQKLPLILDSLQSSVESPESMSDTLPIRLQETLHTLQQLESQLRNASALAEAVLDLDQAPRDFLVRSSYKPELQDLQDELAACQQEMDDSLQEMNELWNQVNGRGSSQSVRLEASPNDGFQFRLPDGNASKTLQTMTGVHIHRVLKNGVYFSTKRLQQLSTQHADLLASYQHHQAQVVADAMPVAASYVAILDPLSLCLAQLDVLVGLASLACHKNYCRPYLTDEKPQLGSGIRLEQARHPCVELHMDFIPNDVNLVFEQSSFMIVTGPNMGGKSTYLRALGAIVTLAQVGSFVPCTSATINLVDAVLARVGAGDQQDRGISTFMAEMLDSAAILNRATSRSLILIDELGRGTSTFDGYGLARAISEYIIKIGCLTVFTTHFHELTALQDSHSSVINYHVTAQKSSAGLVFLYHVQPGPCLESFGIQVAEMAQVPAVVIEDAKRKALELEKFEYRKRAACRSTSALAAVTTTSSVSAPSMWNRFQKIDLRGILQSPGYPTDDAKRAAILAAMGESVDLLIS